MSTDMIEETTEETTEEKSEETSEEKTEETSEETSSIKTNSRLKMWYLTKFGKRRIHAVHHEPLGLFLGVVRYARTWVLVPVEGQ